MLDLTFDLTTPDTLKAVGADLETSLVGKVKCLEFGRLALSIKREDID